MPTLFSPQDLETEYVSELISEKEYNIFEPQKINSRRYENIVISKDKTTIKLIDKEQKDTVALVFGNFVNYHNSNYYEINYTRSKFPKNGFLTYLFDLLIKEFNYKVLSDKQHTSPGSKEFWKSLIRKRSIKVYRINIETNYKRNAKRFEDNKIWSEISTSNIILDELTKFEFIENYHPNIEESELLEQFGDINNIDFIVNDVEESKIKEKERIKSMETIRLVAQNK